MTRLHLAKPICHRVQEIWNQIDVEHGLSLFKSMSQELSTS